MAKLDAEASRQYPLHRSLSDLPAEQLADLQPLEAYLREHYPEYTLQRAMSRRPACGTPELDATPS